MSETQANNPLHGITLEMILNQLVAHYGWEKLGQEIEIRFFGLKSPGLNLEGCDLHQRLLQEYQKAHSVTVNR